MLRYQQTWAMICNGRVLSVLKNHPTTGVMFIFLSDKDWNHECQEGSTHNMCSKLSQAVFQETPLKQVPFGTVLVKITSHRKKHKPEENKHSGLTWSVWQNCGERILLNPNTNRRQKKKQKNMGRFLIILLDSAHRCWITTLFRH